MKFFDLILYSHIAKEQLFVFEKGQVVAYNVLYTFNSRYCKEIESYHSLIDSLLKT